MKKILLLIISLFLCQNVYGAVPVVFTNGTVADATEVNSNFDYFELKFSTTGGHDHDGTDSKAITSLTGLTIIGNITTGTWQGTIIDDEYGGTGLSTYATGDLIYATSDTALGNLAAATANYVLTANGTNTAPSYKQVVNAGIADTTIDLTTKVTGVLPAANGGNVTSATKIVAADDSIIKTRADYACDGTADDVQINTAIAACTSGGRVILLEGTYNIAATVDLDVAGITLEGQGWKTILKAIENLNDEVIRGTVDECALKNLYVENSTNAQSALQACVEFYQADDIIIEGIKINGRGDAGDPPLLINDCDRFKILNNKIILSTGGGNAEGIITITGASLYGIVTGNHIDGTAASTDGSCGISGVSNTSGFGYCIISNNYIEGDGAELDYGIVLGNHADYSNNSITGNIIYNMGTDGIFIQGANAANNLIMGNIARDGVTDNGTSTRVTIAVDDAPDVAGTEELNQDN